jgi:hypothetical protein
LSLRSRVRTALLLMHVLACSVVCCAKGAFGQGETASPTPMKAPMKSTGTLAQETPPRNGSTEPRVSPPAMSDSSPRASTPPSPPVEEVRPELYYLKNKDGELEPVLGFSYEDFYRLYRLEQNLQKGAKPPAFRFEKSALSGKVENGRLALRAEFQIIAMERGWVRVPLGMTSALVTEVPKRLEERAGENAQRHAPVVQFDASEGYVIWLNGESDETHTIAFERLLVPLETNGDETRLRLPLARSLTAADVALQLPVVNAVVKSADAATVITTKAAGDAATEASLTARGGELALTWRGGDAAPSVAVRMVEATSAIRATVDDRTILWEAQLTVRSTGEPLESFDVRLPAGAQLDPPAPGPFVVSVSGDAPRVATVSMRKATAEPVTLRLICRRNRNVAEPKETIDFAGFDVVRATRQSGAFVVAINGDWRIAWQNRKEIRETEEPPESLAPPEDQQAYSFEFYGQPFALSGEIATQPARLDVEPQYHVAVEADRLLLSGRLMYKVRGSKVARVNLQLAGWELVDIGPEGVVQSAGAALGDDGQLSIPLTQRMRSSFELTITARRPLVPTTGRVDFSLPSASADVIAPPTLIVDAAENVDLMPIEAELSQLTPRGNGTPAPTTPVKRRHPPLVYRVLGDGREARFVATQTIRSREITARSSTDVRIASNRVDVEQQIDLSVAFEALNRVVLDVPSDLAARRDVTYAIDGEPVLPITGPAIAAVANEGVAELGANSGANRANSSPSTVRIALEPLTAIVDRARISVRYEIRSQSGDVANVIAVPLAKAAEAAVLESVVRVSSATVGQISAETPWTATGEPSTSSSPTTPIAFTTNEPVNRIDLRTSILPRRTVVHATWIRTAVADGMRQDRATFRLETDEPAVDIALPAGVRDDRVAVWVNQQSVVPRFVRGAGQTSGSALRIAADLLPARAGRQAANSKMHSVEVLYNLDEANGSFGQHHWEPPRIVGATWEMRTLWEVVMPQNEHIMADPDGFTPEYRWQWGAALRWGDVPLLPILGRRANLNTTELQRITRATRLRIADGQTNRYLFSTSGAASDLEFQTLSRTWIVLIASGAVIALGALLIYAPAARRPFVLLVTAVILLATAAWSPSAAILGAQAAAVGLLLAIAAGVGSWWLADRKPVSAPASTPAHRIERGSSANRPRPEERSGATTLTIPADLNAGDVHA